MAEADQDGYVLYKIVQNRRNIKAARRLLARLPKKERPNAKAHHHR
jgi:transposase-like protein